MLPLVPVRAVLAVSSKRIACRCACDLRLGTPSHKNHSQVTSQAHTPPHILAGTGHLEELALDLSQLQQRVLGTPWSFSLPGPVDDVQHQSLPHTVALGGLGVTPHWSTSYPPKENDALFQNLCRPSGPQALRDLANPQPRFRRPERSSFCPSVVHISNKSWRGRTTPAVSNWSLCTVQPSAGKSPPPPGQPSSPPKTLLAHRSFGLLIETRARPV